MAGRKKATTHDVTWDQLVSILGVGVKDGRVLDVLARLGRAAPKAGVTILWVKPHGVTIELEERVVAKITLAITPDDDVGVWRGGMPAGASRDMTEAAAEALGGANDQFGFVTLPPKDGVRLVFEFDSDGLMRLHAERAPE